MFARSRRIRTGLRRSPHPNPKTKPSRELIPFLTHVKSTRDPTAALTQLLSPASQSPPSSTASPAPTTAPTYPPSSTWPTPTASPSNPHVLNSLIHHFPQDAHFLFSSIPKTTTQNFNFLYNALVGSDCVEQAEDLLFNRSKIRPNAVSYNVVLKGVVERNGFDAAGNVFNEMRTRGVLPPVVIYNVLIGFLSRNWEVGWVRKMMDEMAREGVEVSAVTYGVLMEGLCREGRVEGARKLMLIWIIEGARMHYGVLMSDCRRRGHFEGMGGLVKEMKKRRMKMDGVTYIILVNYLCNGGRVDEAYKVLVEMRMEGCEQMWWCIAWWWMGFVWQGNLIRG